MRIATVVCSVLLGVACAGNAQASSTLRVGSQVLVAGDSAARVTALLGKPSYTAHRRAKRSGSGSRRRGGVRVVTQAQEGEQWQYRRDGHVTTITIIDGRVSDIQERRR
jgi:hypothetical protein